MLYFGVQTFYKSIVVGCGWYKYIYNLCYFLVKLCYLAVVDMEGDLVMRRDNKTFHGNLRKKNWPTSTFLVRLF